MIINIIIIIIIMMITVVRLTRPPYRGREITGTGNHRWRLCGVSVYAIRGLVAGGALLVGVTSDGFASDAGMLPQPLTAGAGDE